jgi:hypothetical protein
MDRTSGATAVRYFLGVKVAVLLALAAGCTSVGTASDDAPLVQVDSVVSTSGDIAVAMLAHGTAPARGMHDMQLVLTHVSDGSPVDGLSLEVVPWMPAMGHGTSLTPTVTALGDGVYEIDDLDLYMAGQWELRASFGTPADKAAPALQIE